MDPISLATGMAIGNGSCPELTPADCPEAFIETVLVSGWDPALCIFGVFVAYVLGFALGVWVNR